LLFVKPPPKRGIKGVRILTEEINHDTDVLVIGGGISGAFAAIKAREAGIGNVLQVCKGNVGKSGCSAFAAGFFNVPLPTDDLDTMFKDMVKDGGYLRMQDRVQDHLEQAHLVLKDMLDFGVRFVTKEGGELERVPGWTRDLGLMFNGPNLMEAMRKATLERGIEQVNRVMVTDLLVSHGRVVGAVGFDIRTGDFHIFRAKVTILAAGMCRYKSLPPGHRDTTGDGTVAALRAGAVVCDTESDFSLNNAFVAHYDIGPGMNMYVGQGGCFINGRGERFMEKYDPIRKDRAIAGVRCQALGMEVRQGKGPIYMDMTHLTPEQVGRIREALPLATLMHERAGFLVGDRFVKPIEWMITAPHAQVGLSVNRRFETSLPGLYACGEATAAQAMTKSLGCAATSGMTAGVAAASYAREASEPQIDREQVAELREQLYQPLRGKEGIEPDQVVLALQEIVVPYNVLLIKHGERMKKAIQEVEDIRENQVPLLLAYDPHYLRMALEARNMVRVAELQLRGALFRTESRVTLREDYPYTDDVNWLKWINMQQVGEEIKVSRRCQLVEVD
jgi:succinate dehydrogenase/fumarate reductase flavoprotein subunit